MTFPAAPVPYSPYQVPARRTARTWDVILGWTLFGFACLIGLCAAYATIFFAFAADSCNDQTCNSDYIGLAFVVSWGGTAVALVGALVMLIVSTVKGWLMWYWPVIATAIVVGGFFAGFALAMNAIGS